VLVLVLLERGLQRLVEQREADLGLVELPLDVGDERLGELPPPLGQPDADRPPVLRDDRAYSRLLRGT